MRPAASRQGTSPWAHHRNHPLSLRRGPRPLLLTEPWRSASSPHVWPTAGRQEAPSQAKAQRRRRPESHPQRNAAARPRPGLRHTELPGAARALHPLLLRSAGRTLRPPRGERLTRSWLSVALPAAGGCLPSPRGTQDRGEPRPRAALGLPPSGHRGPHLAQTKAAFPLYGGAARRKVAPTTPPPPPHQPPGGSLPFRLFPLPHPLGPGLPHSGRAQQPRALPARKCPPPAGARSAGSPPPPGSSGAGSGPSGPAGVPGREGGGESSVVSGVRLVHWHTSATPKGDAHSFFPVCGGGSKRLTLNPHSARFSPNTPLTRRGAFRLAPPARRFISLRFCNKGHQAPQALPHVPNARRRPENQAARSRPGTAGGRAAVPKGPRPAWETPA